MLKLQQEIILSGETVSSTTTLFQYMREFSNRNKIKALFELNMTDIITLLENNGKLDVYTGGNIHGLYYYLDMIGVPTRLTASGQRYHHFGPSYSINNDTASLQTVIVALCIRQKTICGLCGRIEHKDDSYIICVPKFLPPSIRININRFSSIHGE